VNQSALATSWAIAVLVIWISGAAALFVWMIRSLAVKGGKVSVKEFAEPELIVCIGLIVWIITNIVTGFGRPDKEVTSQEIVRGSAMFLGMIGLLLMFLQYRNINPLRQFGLTKRNPFACLGIGAGLALCVQPVLWLVEQATNAAMHGDVHPQNVVEFFLTASQKSDTKGMVLLLLMAVVVAPITEETLFRGFIYGVLKRYIGAIGAAVVSAGLFAALHLNLGALPALFVLALCLTLAYEATGSLLANICMHAFFNLTMLLLILYITAHAPSELQP
jgi:uncharacterized protein